MKKYTPLSPMEQAAVTLGLCAAVVDSVMQQFPEGMRHKRIYRQLTDMNSRLLGILDSLDKVSPRVEALAVSGELADGFNQLLDDLGLIETVQPESSHAPEDQEESQEGKPQSDSKPAA